MADYNINLTIQNIWSVFRVVIDIAIMWFIIYYAIKAIRNNSRTIQIFKGIIAIIAVNGLAKLLGLSTLTYFTDMFINWGLLAFIIIFQPEIRGFLEKIGTSNAFSRISSLLANEKEKLVDQVYEATITLSKERVGALISIEQAQSLQDYIKTGITVNAEVSKELLCSLFMTTTPLHDGAVIIQGDKVACASAYFPPTNVNLSSRYGARHRAALGIAEVSDALTIVVSEETSAISIAENGRIFSVDEKQLKEYLRRVICNDTTAIEKTSRRRNSLVVQDDSDVIVEIKEDPQEKKGFSLFRKKNNVQENQAKKEETAQLDMKVPTNNRFKYGTRTERNEHLFDIEEDVLIENNLDQEASHESDQQF
ncbi:MAG: diadenylate cyclase CdaA [Erysipelotrichaceae bacterium]|nr:diadenylate cyclase CdaA [Erysipelotrichaceae bacterium]